MWLFSLICVQINAQFFSQEIDISKSINYPETSAIVDIDLDGDLDVFCTSIGDGKIAFFENLGSGQFAEIHVISYSARSSTQLFFEDLNNDGLVDLLSTSSDLQGVFWLENLGNGNFGPEQVIQATYSGIAELKAQDIDNDNDIDLIIHSGFSSSFAFQTFKNDGSGNFTLLENFFSFDEEIGFIESADLNGDGFADLLLNNTLEDIFIYFPNSGDGTFMVPDTFETNYSLGHKIELFDFDMDGDLDILTGQFVSPGTLVWYPNNGAGNFGSPIAIQEGFNNFKDIELGDFDNDGDIDFVVLATQIKYLENLGSGTFATLTYIDEDIIGLESISSGDFTGNGFLDIVIASHGLGWDDYLTRFENGGNASFSAPIFFNPQDPSGPHAVAIGDIDGDGDEDIATATLYNDLVVWYENNGTGQFEESHITSIEENEGYRHIELADLDSDGDLDIITGSSSDNHIAWQANDGNGNFSPMLTLTDDVDYPRDFEIDDLDADGDMDICAISFDDGEVYWFPNDGSQNFPSLIILSENSHQARQIATEDLNEDGLLDIISCSFGADGLVWYPNLGGGSFNAANHLALNDDVKTFTLGDFNFDGHIDIFAIGGPSRKYLNDGSGNFDSSQEQLNVFPPNDIHSMDIDNDGDLDLTMAGTGGIQYAFNGVANGFYEAENLRNYSASFVDLNSADLDNDGDEDLVYVDIFSDRVAILMNQSSLGCTDNTACNYDTNASEDDGSCCYNNCGCTNNSAFNFNSSATCDDGSCEYSTFGFVYFDGNNNGIYDSLDYGLANQEIVIDAAGISTFTNNDGFFSVDLNEEGELTFSLQPDNDFPFPTTATQITHHTDSLGWNTDTLFFGTSNTVAFFDLEVNIYSATNLCIDVNPYNLVILNNGTVPLQTEIEFQKDSLLEWLSFGLPPSSLTDHTASFSIDSLLPGQNLSIPILFNPVSADNIGDSIVNNLNVEGFHIGALVASGNDAEERIVQCSYDPNDKQVFPEGYNEEHWVQNDTILEYMIRFQNTGNAPAQNIWIRDSLDINLDLNSFEFIASSHSVATSIDPENRELLFFFEDIMLPDSVNNEPDSHGFVRFSIQSDSNTPLLTEINNTAHIFFDNNDPIITNTTWSVLYDCSLFEASFIQEMGVLIASEGDYYQWYLDGQEISGANEQTINIEENGFYSVLVGIDFPCSDLSPETFINYNGLGSIEEIPFNLYPNPANNWLILEVKPEAQILGQEIRDLAGRTIALPVSKKENQLFIETEELSSGTYLIHVLTDLGSINAKLIIRK